MASAFAPPLPRCKWARPSPSGSREFAPADDVDDSTRSRSLPLPFITAVELVAGVEVAVAELLLAVPRDGDEVPTDDEVEAEENCCMAAAAFGNRSSVRSWIGRSRV